MACPVCGSSDRVELSPGFFECRADRIKGLMPAVGGLLPQPFVVPCGTKYQEGVGFALARCYACGLNSVGFCACHNSPVCGMHFKHVNGVVMCLLGIKEAQDWKAAQECVRHAAEVEDSNRKGAIAREAFIDSLRTHSAERAELVLAVIGRCTPRYDPGDAWGGDKWAGLQPHLYALDVVPELPERRHGRPGSWGGSDCLPEDLDDEVARWFVKKAAEQGLTPNSGVVVGARQRVFGDGMVYKYAVGWRFPGAGEEEHRASLLRGRAPTAEQRQYIDHEGVGLGLSGSRDTKNLRLSMTSLFGMAMLLGLADPEKASEVHSDVRHWFVPRQDFGLPFSARRYEFTR